MRLRPYRAPGSVFAGTALFYARTRPGYPAELIDRCVRFAAVFPGRRVLDLATGTGAVALALAEQEVDVLAVDPCAEMLEEARRTAAERGVTNVEWRQGSSYELPDCDGVCLVTIGDAFHWMIPAPRPWPPRRARGARGSRRSAVPPVARPPQARPGSRS